MTNPTPIAAVPNVGVRIAGTGSALPNRVVTNNDLRETMETSDEWIRQRTGIRERRLCNRDEGEGPTSLCTLALQRALEDAHLDPTDLDFVSTQDARVLHVVAKSKGKKRTTNEHELTRI